MRLDEATRRYADWIARKRPALAAEAWSEAFADYPYAVNAAAPLVPPRKPLAACRVGLLSTGGVHLASQPAFDLSDPEGDLSFREIPLGARTGELRLAHRTYEKTWAERDVNVVLPIERLGEFAEERETGPLAAVVSTMGSVTNVPRLVGETLPAIVAVFERARCDVALLVPL